MYSLQLYKTNIAAVNEHQHDKNQPIRLSLTLNCTGPSANQWFLNKTAP